MYESALETGDHLGEFRLWVERMPLNERIPFPCGFVTCATTQRRR
jgi:hypothetical protein